MMTGDGGVFVGGSGGVSGASLGEILRVWDSEGRSKIYVNVQLEAPLKFSGPKSKL